MSNERINTKEIEYTCIVCPQSCKVTLSVSGDGSDNPSYEVDGNICKRGKTYVIDEYTNPQRMLTTTVKIRDAVYSNLPVVSEGTVERRMLGECLRYLYSIEVEAPVVMGDVLVEDILGTGVNILAARDMAYKI